jgi:hypothetical protein
MNSAIHVPPSLELLDRLNQNLLRLCELPSKPVRKARGAKALQ